MKRIAIIGSPGAGKSTLARQLGEITGLPVHHLDRLYWRPGWQTTPREEWLTLQRNLVAGERWIIDGNYGSSLELRVTAADTVVFLDLPGPLCFWRVLKRSWQHWGKTRPDLAEGCPETLDWEFVRFVVGFRRKERPGVLLKLAQYAADKPVIHLTSPGQVAAFLRKLKG